MSEKWVPVVLMVSFPNDLTEYVQELEGYYSTKELIFVRPSGAAVKARSNGVTRTDGTLVVDLELLLPVKKTKGRVAPGGST